MTVNKKRKRAAREYAKENGLTYCQALRVLSRDDTKAELEEAPEKQMSLAEVLAAENEL